MRKLCFGYWTPPPSFLVAILLLTLGAVAESQQRIPLSISETKEASILVGTAAFPAKCGEDGSVYVRFFSDGVMAPSRISSGGDVKLFSTNGTRYFRKASIWDFAPAENGGIHELVFYRLEDREAGYRILTFSKDGRLEGDVRLDVDFDAQHIATFRNGYFLVEGRKSTSDGGHKGPAAMAIVDGRGQVVTKLKLEGDLSAPKKSNDAASPEMGKRAEEEFNFSLDLSTALSADDGKVYVLRQSSTGPLFSISPDGTVRVIKLPSFGDALINSALVSRGRVLVHYVKSERMEDGARKTDLGFYSLYELSTMEKVAEYAMDPTSVMRNSIPACYNGNEVFFLRINEKHHPILLTAKPR